MGRGLSQETLDLIEASRNILAIHKPQGVRATCYQLFNQKLIPDMSLKWTKKISGVLTTARQRGMIPWDWISDEKREFEIVNSWATPSDFMDTVRDAYRLDRWARQPFRIAVVSEKERGGTLRPVTKEYGIPFVVYSGFTSTTAVKKLAEESTRDKRPFIVLYVGDFDPSGMNMSDRDLPGRITEYGGRATVRRVAIRPGQIEEYRLQANTFPASDKKTDPRYAWFAKTHGGTCCELDALPANDLRGLIEDAILDHLDIDAWEYDGEMEENDLIHINDAVDAFRAMRAGV